MKIKLLVTTLLCFSVLSLKAGSPDLKYNSSIPTSKINLHLKKDFREDGISPKVGCLIAATGFLIMGITKQSEYKYTIDYSNSVPKKVLVKVPWDEDSSKYLPIYTGIFCLGFSFILK